jgi:hypothetical protein
MTDERWWGAVAALIGVYFFVCAIWKQEFFLYQLKTARAVEWFGNEAAHFIFGTIGLLLIIGGAIKLLGYF